MNVFLDTSVFLRWILNHPKKYTGFNKWKTCYISEIFYIEFNRVLNRMRLEREINDLEFATLRNNFLEFYDTIHVIQFTNEIREIASQAFPTILGTLDSIHLASALLLKKNRIIKNLKLLTHDKQMGTAATAMGFEVVGL